MMTYKFEIREPFLPDVLEGQIEEDSRSQALQVITEIYETALGCDRSTLMITITEVV